MAEPNISLDPDFLAVQDMLRNAEHFVPVEITISYKTRGVDDRVLGKIIDEINSIVCAEERAFLSSMKLPLDGDFSFRQLAELQSAYENVFNSSKRFVLYDIRRGSVVISGVIFSVVGLFILKTLKDGWEKSETKVKLDRFVAEAIDWTFTRIFEAVKRRGNWNSSGVSLVQVRVEQTDQGHKLIIELERPHKD